jgi:hypothetical protein
MCFLELGSEGIQFLLIVKSEICSTWQSILVYSYYFRMNAKSQLKTANGNKILVNEI